MNSLKEKHKKTIISGMKEKFGYKNAMETPSLLKAVINCGVGRYKDDNQLKEIKKYLEMISGQSVADKGAKQSIASFKTREGSLVGYAVTLRGKRMYDFLERMVMIAIPRMRDFRGIDTKSVDGGGNLTIGIKEHIVFPEIIGEDVKNIFGFEVTFVTNAKSRGEAIEFFKLLGIPFKKNNNG